MKVPYSWLKEFVDIDLSPEELGDKLVSIGFEIEEYIYLRDTIKNVKVGLVESIEKVPNTTHLNLCQINVGNEVLQIVTGAQNVNKGDKVPVALDGAVLPNGKTIKASPLVGIMSYGMLCSGEELGLIEEDYKGAGVYGILILDPNEEVGKDINDVINNNEVVLDVAITANRPDCNSILGIAREVAAVLKKPLKMPELSYKTNNEDVSKYVAVDNQNYSLCPRYMAAAVINAKQMVSPKVMRDRLKAVGIRPINNLVDITNYVLIEIGQPMHAFDLNNLSGQKIVVRNAMANEKITALDGKEYELSPSNLAICDKDKPVAVAGVMGGEYSSICDTTSTVILESARFARDSIRHTARDLNLHSDSSARFEKGIDFYSQQIGLNRALALFDKYNWGTIVGGQIDKCNSDFAEKEIVYDYNDINKIIGVNLDKNIMIDILNSLSIKTTANGDILTSIIPLYREDIEGVNDLTEEIIRLYGYDIIEPRVTNNMRGERTDEQLRMDKIKNILVGKGCLETVSYSFITPKAFDLLNLSQDSIYRAAIELKNPLGSDMSVMRTTLSYSMIKTIEYNYTHGNKQGRFFEIANTYIPKDLPLVELPTEEEKLVIGFMGKSEDYYSIKSVIDDLLITFGFEPRYTRANLEFLHPGRSAFVFANDVKIGYVGEIHPDVLEKLDIPDRFYFAELDVRYIADKGIDIKPFKAISKFQDTTRDLALVCSRNTFAQDILDIVKNSCSNILENVEVFDVYTGDQIDSTKKSIAITLSFRDANKTLTEQEVNAEIEKTLSNLAAKGITLR